MSKVLWIFVLLAWAAFSPCVQAWTRQSGPTTDSLIDVQFSSATHGGVVSSSSAWLTSDGGNNWSTPFTTASCYAITVPANPIAFILTNNSNQDMIYRTTDWGTTWRAVWHRLGHHYVDIDVDTSGYGILVGRSSADSTRPSILVTTDMGNTWVERYDSTSGSGLLEHCDIASRNPGQSIAAGSQRFIATPSSGVWHSTLLPAPFNALSASAFLGAGTAFLLTGDAGDIYWYSGDVWNYSAIPGHETDSIHGGALADLADRWAVGPHGLIAHMPPGSSSWTIDPAPPTVNTLRKVSFVGQVGWAVGDSGTVIHYALPAEFIPSPVAPLCGSTVTTEPIVFNWTDSTGDPGYRVQISDSLDFGRILFNQMFVTNTCTLRTLPNGTYFWRVRLQGAGGFGSWDTPCTFNVTLGSPIVLLNPACGESLTADTVNLLWSAAGYDRWDVQLATMPTFDSLYHSFSGLTDTFASFALPIGQWYYRVRGITVGAPYGPWTVSCGFTLIPPVMPIPLPVAPTCGDTVWDWNARIQWRSDFAYPAYEVQVCPNPIFREGLLFSRVEGITELAELRESPTLAKIGVRYWRVRGITAGGGASPWSSTCSFDFQLQPPFPTQPVCADTIRSLEIAFACTLRSDYPAPLSHNLRIFDRWGNMVRDTSFALPSIVMPRNLATGNASGLRYQQWGLTYGDSSSSAFGTPCTFFVATPAPIPLRPACGDTVHDTLITFGWDTRDTYDTEMLQLNVSLFPTFPPESTFDTTVAASDVVEYRDGEDGTSGTRRYWRIRGVVGPGDYTPWSETCTYIREIPARPIPRLIFPTCGDTVWSMSFAVACTLRDWPKFRLRMAGDREFRTGFVDTVIAGPRSEIRLDYAVAANLSDIFMQIEGVDTAGAHSDFGPTCEFYLVPLEISPTTTYPACGDSLDSPPLEARASFIGSPEFQGLFELAWHFADDSGLVRTAMDTITPLGDSVASLARIYIPGRPTYGDIYWRVRGQLGTHQTAWSPDCKYTVRPPRPHFVHLLEPFCGGRVTDSVVTFLWQADAGSRTEIQVALDEGFGIIYHDDIGYDDRAIQYADLPWNASIYWRARVTGDSTWVTCSFFHQHPVVPIPPVVVSPTCPDTVRGDSLIWAWHPVAGAAEYRITISIRLGPMNSLISGRGDQSDISIITADTTVRFPPLDCEGPAPGGVLPIPRTYFWAVRTVYPDGDSSNYNPICTLIVYPPNPPTVPVLLEPPSGSTFTGEMVTFSWSASRDSVGRPTREHTATLKCGVDSLIQRSLFEITTGDTFITHAVDTSIHTVFWQVRFDNGTCLSQWSPISMFDHHGVALPMPIPDMACGTVIAESLVHIAWTYDGPPGPFQVLLSSDSHFTSGLVQTHNGIIPTFYDLSGLGDGTYYWRVRVTNYRQFSPWSDACSFTVARRGLGRAVLTGPLCGDTVGGPPVLFAWQAVAGADSYLVQLSGDGLFSPPTNLPVTNRPGFEFIPDDGYRSGVRYWRVVTFGGDTSSLSRACTFDWSREIVLTAPVLVSPVCGTHHYIGMVTLVRHMVHGASHYQTTITGPMIRDIVLTSRDTVDQVRLPFPGVYQWSAQAFDSRSVAGPSSEACTLFVMDPRGVPSTVFTQPRTQSVILINTAGGGTMDFAWQPISVVDSYEVQVTDDPMWGGFLTGHGITAANDWSAPLSDFHVDHGYYARVRCIVAPEGHVTFGPWSPVVSFRISDATFPAIHISTSPDTFTTLPICLHWTNMGPGSRYDLRFSSSALFDSLYFEADNLQDTSFCLTESTFTMHLPVDSTIYWDVTPVFPGTGSQQPRSDPGNFLLGGPGAPPDSSGFISLGSIASLLCGQTDTVDEGSTAGFTVSWNPDPQATSYELQASSAIGIFSNDYVSIAYDRTVTEPSFTFSMSDFSRMGPTIFWRVRSLRTSTGPGWHMVFPPGPWSNICLATRLVKLNPCHITLACGDSTLATESWLNIGIQLPWDSLGLIRMEVVTLSDDGWGPIDSIVTDRYDLRTYSSIPDRWFKWKFRLRAMPNRGDDRYLPSEAMVCSLFYGYLAPVTILDVYNGSSTVDVSWSLRTGVETGYNVYRSSDETGVFALVGSADPSGVVYHDSTARADRAYYYYVDAYNSEFGKESERLDPPVRVYSTFLPERDGINYANAWTNTVPDTIDWVTWDLFVRTFGEDQIINHFTGRPRMGPIRYWLSLQSSIWRGSCVGYATVARFMEARYNSGGPLFGASDFDITNRFWDGGESSGRLYQYYSGSGSTLTSQMTQTINAIQIADLFGTLPHRGFTDWHTLWNQISAYDGIFGDSLWQIGFTVIGWGGHEVVPYRCQEMRDGTQRIYVYDCNHPGSNTCYFEYNFRSSGADSLIGSGMEEIPDINGIYTIPLHIYKIELEPNRVWRGIPGIPFELFYRYSQKAAGTSDYLDLGDSLFVMVHGAAHPLFINSVHDSMGWYSGNWFERMSEGHIRMGKVRPDSSYEPFPYIMNPDSYRVELRNPTGRDSTYQLSIIRPGRMVIVDSLRIGAGQTDYLWIGPTGEDIRFRPGGDRSFQLTVYHTTPDWDETMFQVNTRLAAGDSAGFSLYGPLGDSLRFDNWGAPTVYSAVLSRQYTEMQVIPLRHDIAIGHNNTHWITVGSWLSVDTTCIQILADTSGDGVVDTTFCATSDVEDMRLSSGGHFEILFAHPNPISSYFLAQFYNPKPQLVEIRLYDVTGKDLGAIQSLPTPAGKQSFYWPLPSSGAIPNGIYFLRFRAGTEERLLKVAVNK